MAFKPIGITVSNGAPPPSRRAASRGAVHATCRGARAGELGAKRKERKFVMYATNLVETARCAPPPPPRRRARARAAPRALQTRVAVRRMIVADPALPPIQRGAARFIHGERCFTSTTDCDDYLQMQQRGASQLAATPCSSPSPSRTTRRWRAGASSSRCTCCASTSRSTTSASGCADASPRAARARPPCTRAQEHGILVAIFPMLKLRKTERCAAPAARARPAPALHAQRSPRLTRRRGAPARRRYSAANQRSRRELHGACLSNLFALCKKDDPSDPLKNGTFMTDSSGASRLHYFMLVKLNLDHLEIWIKCIPVGAC